MEKEIAVSPYEQEKLDIFGNPKWRDIKPLDESTRLKLFHSIRDAREWLGMPTRKGFRPITDFQIKLPEETVREVEAATDKMKLFSALGWQGEPKFSEILDDILKTQERLEDLTMEQTLESKKIKKCIVECEDGTTFAGDVTRVEGCPFNLRGLEIGVTFLKETGFCGIERVVFDNPATIVFWMDGTKTVTTCQDNMTEKKKIVDGKEIMVKKPGKADTYSKEIGFAMCVAKKYFGNKGNYNDVFRKFGAIEGGEKE